MGVACTVMGESAKTRVCGGSVFMCREREVACASLDTSCLCSRKTKNRGLVFTKD